MVKFGHCAALVYFNPRSHEGSDISSLPAAILVSSISIHAPTRGATGCPYSYGCISCISIHAPTRGATSGLLYTATRNQAFQSTLPRGERPCSTPHVAIGSNFNPRSHEGSDGEHRLQLHKRDNFNPRSHEGSDITIAHYVCHICISIHAPTRGATTE